MKSSHRGLTARRRFWVAVFALVSLGIMAGGLKYYQYEQDYIRREKYQELAAIADLKVRQIVEWRRERLDDALHLARRPFVRQAIALWLQDPGDTRLRAALLERFKLEQTGETYGNVLLLDPNGRILLSLIPDPAPFSPSERQVIASAVAGRQAVLGDLSRCPKDYRVRLDAAAPVLDSQGRPLAVVVLRINADKVLYPLIQFWPTPSLTAETFLVEVEGKDVLYLNDVRHRGKTALSLREPLTQTELPAVQAALGKRGMYHGRDYRDVEVLADLRPVPQSPWFMVAKVDADEIIAEARYRAGITALFVVILILLTAAVTAYGYRQRQANLYQDLYQSEREQRKAQEEFRTTLYSIGDAVITTDTEGLVKQMNQVAELLTGWLEAEARGKPIEEVFRIINEETRSAVENPVQRVLIEGTVAGLANHTLLIARDGTERPIADSGAPIRDESGTVTGVVLVFRDQTEERAAQNALRESEEKYRLLVNQIPAVVFQGYGDWSVDFFDNKIEILSGYTKEEFDSRKIKWCDLILPEDLNNSHRIFIEALKTDKSYVREYRIRKKDGGISWIQDMGRIFCDAAGKVDHISGVFFDITERKRAEEAFQVLVNYAPMGIYIVQDGKFQLVNPGFEKTTGYTAGELLGRDSLTLVHPDYQEAVRKNATAMVKGEHHSAYEFPFTTKSGETRWVMEKVTATIYQGKRAALGYFMDISEHKSLEDQFLQAQKMEAVGILAGGIAHDFNNILTVILGNIGLAVLDGKIGPRVQDRLAQAEAACLRAQALSQQLLTFAKGGAPVKKLFSVAEFLTQSTSFTCVGSPVRCETTFPENLWSIEADPGQIGQVFQNLTINAIQAMPTGGTIKVWAENLTLGTDSDLPLGAGRYIKISVRDQGMGIPAEHLPRIFDPYFTTKQKGSGLGLASAYAIIKKHHGHIAVESKPGVGTTFHIYLPAVERQVTPQPEEDRELRVGKGKILVMDDEEMVREVLGRILARLGYEAEFARDGGEAIEMFVQAQGSGQAFAAVILDLTVPGGMGGKETMARLLEIDPQIKAVVSSGYSYDPIMADFQKYGFSGVIAKPYRISELSKLLNKVLSKGK